MPAWPILLGQFHNEKVASFNMKEFIQVNNLILSFIENIVTAVAA